MRNKTIVFPISAHPKVLYSLHTMQFTKYNFFFFFLSLIDPDISEMFYKRSEALESIPRSFICSSPGFPCSNTLTDENYLLEDGLNRKAIYKVQLTTEDIMQRHLGRCDKRFELLNCFVTHPPTVRFHQTQKY